MPDVPDKVTTTGLNGGHPFRNLKRIDVKHGTESETPIKSRVEVLPDGRKIIVQIKR